MSEVEQLCGYEKDMGAWPALGMMNLAKMGFQVHWIEDFDSEQFISDPKAYLRTFLDDEAYEWQVQHGDLELEAKRLQEYIQSGLSYEARKATREDIMRFLDDGWLVRLEVNAQTLVSKPGYDGHSILVIGYDENGFTIHNPDGTNGNTPNRYVGWELLNRAWEEYGNTYSLYAFKK